MKKQIAKLLRRWADSLAPSPRPNLVINSHKVQRFRIRKQVSPYTIEERAHKLYYRSQAFTMPYIDAKRRVIDIMKQETIVEAATELAQLLSVSECERDLYITGDLYFKTNEETKI